MYPTNAYVEFTFTIDQIQAESILQILTLLILTATLQNGYYYYPVSKVRKLKHKEIK